MITKSDFTALQNEVRLLATQIGLRPAARAMGLNEDRVRKWSSVGKWKINVANGNGTHQPALDSPQITRAYAVMEQILKHEADRTRFAMARTSRRAFEHADTLGDMKLHDVGTAIALDKHRAIAESAHGWRNANTQVAVQVNVPMPTQAERDEMRQLDAKLDAFAKLLKQNSNEA